MNIRRLILLSALLVSACTFTPENGEIRTEFHPPFVYQAWHTEHYALQNGDPACVVSSGSGGIEIILAREGGNIETAAKSNRPMQPGFWLTVNAGGNTFYAYDTYFHEQTARALADALSKGGKAYLEWAENSRWPGGAPQRAQNIVKLDGFKEQLDACRNYLMSRK